MPRKTEPHIEMAAKALARFMANYFGNQKTWKRFDDMTPASQSFYVREARAILRAAGRGGKVLCEVEQYAVARMTATGAPTKRPIYRRVLVLDAGSAGKSKSRSERSGRNKNR
jgi:hypothetical protein